MLKEFNVYFSSYQVRNGDHASEIVFRVIHILYSIYTQTAR